MENISIIILTFNEEIHIELCLKKISQVSNNIFIIDSFSTDKTIEIAQNFKVNIIQNKFINQAQQLQWAIDNCQIDSEWVIRIDADEYLTSELIEEIQHRLTKLASNINGIVLKRRHYFLNKWIRFGDRYPLCILRIWRNKKVRVEQKWMDEHIVLLEGESIIFEHDFIDHNLNNITWFIEKHNNYATREAIELIISEDTLTKDDNISFIKAILDKSQRNRFLKNMLYKNHLLLLRSCIYFFYRYFFLFGFLDGKSGLIYHFLQGFWYRFLVDSKIIEIKYVAFEKKITIQEAITEVTGYKNFTV